MINNVRRNCENSKRNHGIFKFWKLHKFTPPPKKIEGSTEKNHIIAATQKEYFPIPTFILKTNMILSKQTFRSKQHWMRRRGRRSCRGDRSLSLFQRWSVWVVNAKKCFQQLAMTAHCKLRGNRLKQHRKMTWSERKKFGNSVRLSVLCVFSTKLSCKIARDVRENDATPRGLLPVFNYLADNGPISKVHCTFRYFWGTQ